MNRHFFALLSIVSASILPSVNAAVPTMGLIAWYLFSGDARDGGPLGINGTVHTAVLTSDRFGRPNSAYRFNGTSSYIELPGNDVFSVSTTGQMSISVWMRPDTLMFSKWEGSGYVHWMGKGQSGAHEWTFRMYNSANDENRPNRTSFYLFNLSGGLGAGSYVEEPVAAGTWMHFVAVANTARDTIIWYKNGVRRDSDPIYNSDYKIVPQNGPAPVRIGTRDFASYFQGAIDDIRFYNRELTAAEVLALYNEAIPTGVVVNAHAQTRHDCGFAIAEGDRVLLYDIKGRIVAARGGTAPHAEGVYIVRDEPDGKLKIGLMIDRK